MNSSHSCSISSSSNLLLTIEVMNAFRLILVAEDVLLRFESLSIDEFLEEIGLPPDILEGLDGGKGGDTPPPPLLDACFELVELLLSDDKEVDDTEKENSLKNAFIISFCFVDDCLGGVGWF